MVTPTNKSQEPLDSILMRQSMQTHQHKIGLILGLLESL